MRYTLPLRIGLLSLAITGLGVAGIAYLAYRDAGALLTGQSFRTLAADVVRETKSLETAIDRYRQDVLILAQSREVRGLMGAAQAGGGDARENATVGTWRDRLGELLATLLRNRADLLQARLIGVADGGREIARAERLGDRVSIVPEADLQRKGDRYYVAETLALTQGPVYVSPIDLNREHGRIQVPAVPVVRIATPVTAADGTPFGIVIINAMFHELARGFRDSPDGITYFIANQRGDYLLHPDPGKEFAFEFERRARVQDDYPVSRSVLEARTTGGAAFFDFADRNVGMVAHRLHFDPLNPDRFLLAGAVASHTVLLAESAGFGRRLAVVALVLGIALTVLSVLAAALTVRRTREQLQTVIDDQAEMVCRFTPDGTLTFLNSAFAAHYGCRTRDLSGAKLSDPALRGEWRVIVHTLAGLTPGYPMAYDERRVLSADGEERWQAWHTRAFFDGRGRMVEAQCVGRDTTGLKRQEVALQASEQRFRDFAGAASDWFWETGPDLRCTYVSETFERILGIAPGRIIGRTHGDLAEGPLGNEGGDGSVDDLEGHRPFKDLRFRARNDAGAEVFCSISGVPMFDDRGAFQGFRGIGSDITARVHAKADVVLAQARLHDAIESIADGFALCDAGDRLVLWNANYRRGMPWAGDVLAPGVPFVEVVRAAANSGMILDAEGRREEWIEERMAWHRTGGRFQVRRYTDGRRFEIHESRTREGGTVIIRRDVTAREIAAETLRRSQASLADAQRIARLGSWDLDVVGNALSWSDQTYRIFGLEPGATVATYDAFLATVHPDDRELVETAVKAALYADVPYSLDHRIVLPDGTERIVHEEAEVSFDDSGIPVRMTGTVQDITEQRRAEEDVRKLSRAVEQSPAMVVITDTDGAIEYANPRFYEVTGYRPEDVVGRNPRILKSGQMPAETYADLWATITAGREWHGELRNRKKNGDIFVAGATIAPIRDGDGTVTHFLGVEEDITKTKETQAQLMHMSTLASLGEMATGIAHELNQPLSVIRMAADSTRELLAEDAVPAAVLASKLDRISRQTDRAAAIIEHVRAFGRRPDEASETVCLRYAVLAAASMIQEQLRLNQIAVGFHLPPSARLVRGRGVQMEQILINLLANSRDAIRDKRQRLGTETSDRIDVHLADGPERGQLRLSVRDSGGGIPSEFLDRVFEPFFTTKQVGEGTGLGLSISYGIVKEMGGTIAAANVNGGAEFTIVLPAGGDRREVPDAVCALCPDVCRNGAPAPDDGTAPGDPPHEPAGAT